MNALIVCNGRIRDYSFYTRYILQADLIVGVDGGAAHLKQLGVRPQILLGDFDSISPEDLACYQASDTEIIGFPAEKDMTDTELALNLAADRGAKQIVIIGGLGTRLDHSLANVFLLKMLLDRGVTGVIADEYNEIHMIRDKILLHREEGAKVTLLPFSGNVEGVSTRGLYYPLDHATLPAGSSWGVSNEFVENTAEVTVQNGLLLVIKSRD